MDPVTHFSQSPYVSMDNDPINLFDPWGANTEGASAPSAGSSGSSSGSSGSGTKGGGGVGSGGGSSGGGAPPSDASSSGKGLGFGDDAGFASGWGTFEFPLAYPELNVIDFKPDGYALAIFKGLTSPIAMGIEFGYSALWDHNYIRNSIEGTAESVRVLYHNPEIALEIVENAYEDFKDASGPERARMISAMTSNMAISLAIPSAGLLPKLKLFTKPVTAIELNISGKVVYSRPFTKSNLSLGRKIHNAYKADLHDIDNGLFKEYNRITGIRPDFVDFNTNTIYELKPYNPRGIREGNKQLERYRKIFEERFGGVWKTHLDTY